MGVREKITERLIAGTLEAGQRLLYTVYYTPFTIYVKEWAPGMHTAGAYQRINSLTSIIDQKVIITT